MDDFHLRLTAVEFQDAHRTQPLLIMQERRAARVDIKDAVSPLYDSAVLVTGDDNIRIDVLVLGDDIPLLKTAGLAIAMANASAEVKAAASDIAPDVDHSGVSVAIRKYLL